MRCDHKFISSNFCVKCGWVPGGGLGLTNRGRRARMLKSKKRTFVFKCSWPSTCKYVTIEARDEDEAFEKAERRRDLKGCKKIDFVREKDA